MYEFHPYYTNDGSVGLYNKSFNDIYHSATGALTEAYEKFIMPIDFDLLMKKESIKVLDICYGIGYNSKSFLNFIFENYILKKFSIKNILTKKNIAQIYTDNNSINNKIQLGENINIYNEQIHTYNTLPEIYIKAVDNDKNLSYLSPFIKTGQKFFKNRNLDFEYKNIEKYLKADNKILKHKINKIINYLIFEKLIENDSEILENDEISNILNSPKYSAYFDGNIKGIYNLYRNRLYKNTPLGFKAAFLHNIYYRHVSKCYKRVLKRYKLQDIKFHVENDDARNAIQNDNNLYNLIFLDAFTPSKCPCLWSYEFFKLLHSHLEEDGMILTYSTSASIRSAMVEAGFSIGNIFNQRENKFNGTIAVKNKSLIKYPLSEFDLGLLKTTAGIFYRDESLTGLNEAIIEARNSEVKNSSRISSSHYKKEFNKEQIC